MLTRFKTNIALYPRLFNVTLVLCIIGEYEIVAPRFVGIDTPHSLYLLGLELAVALVLAVPIYWYVTTKHTSMLLDILNRFEGRQVCNVADHVEELEESEDTEEDNPETYA